MIVLRTPDDRFSGLPDFPFEPHYATISNAGKASWVALKPVTGRTHQLRFHMAELGCAILGDKLGIELRPVRRSA